MTFLVESHFTAIPTTDILALIPAESARGAELDAEGVRLHLFITTFWVWYPDISPSSAKELSRPGVICTRQATPRASRGVQPLFLDDHKQSRATDHSLGHQTNRRVAHTDAVR